MAAAVHRQHAAELRPLPGGAVPGDQLQELFQGLPGQGWQKQSPALPIELQGEHLAQALLREVLQG